MKTKILTAVLLILAIIIFVMFFWKMVLGLTLMIIILFLGYRVLFNKSNSDKR